MEMKNHLLIWPDSGLTTKSNHVNAPYHFIHMGEVANYVNKRLEHNVDVLDIEATGVEFTEVMKEIIEKNYDSVAMYLNSENLGNGLNLLEFIKTISPNCKVLCYGELPLFLKDFFKKTKFDAIINTDCDQESAILDFFKYANSIEKEKLHDILLVENRELIETKKGKIVEPKDWGFSDPKEVPLDSYTKMEGKNQYVMTLSRGCPYGCKYCNATLYYGTCERRRPVEDIIKFINENDYDYYKFFSPNFTLNKKEAYKLCKEIIKNGKKIKWSCTTRPDLVNDEELISLMSLAGCYKIAIGIETISKKDLDSIEKKYDQSLIINGIELLKKYGIEYKALVMFGVPDQSKESILETIEFMKENGLEIRPTAYTPFYEMNENMTAEEISKYDKRTFYKGIDGLSYADFLRLIYDTKNYEKVLVKKNEK